MTYNFYWNSILHIDRKLSIMTMAILLMNFSMKWNWHFHFHPSVNRYPVSEYWLLELLFLLTSVTSNISSREKSSHLQSSSSLLVCSFLRSPHSVVMVPSEKILVFWWFLLCVSGSFSSLSLPLALPRLRSRQTWNKPLIVICKQAFAEEVKQIWWRGIRCNDDWSVAEFWVLRIGIQQIMQQFLWVVADQIILIILLGIARTLLLSILIGTFR